MWSYAKTTVQLAGPWYSLIQFPFLHIQLSKFISEKAGDEM